MYCMLLSVFFFFKQKTAYEMRISDWSSDVCSSDLRLGQSGHRRAQPAQRIAPARDRRPTGVADTPADIVQCAHGRGQRIERGPEQGLEQGRRHAIQARVAMRPLRPSRRWEKKRRGSEIVHSPPPYAARSEERSEENTSELQS